MAGFPQPSEQNILDFLSIVPDVSREEVIARLKHHNCNAEAAVGEYFDNGSSTKYRLDNDRWDDTVFNSDRNGASNNQSSIPSFNIHGPDEMGPFNQFDGAMGPPTRPPSRTSNNKSPMSRVIDMTDASLAADPSTSQTYGGGQSDLDKAMALSLQEAGLPPQQSGVTNTNEVHFGPATRSQYDQDNWAMVPIGASVQEIILDPEPAQRKRDFDAPAFLRPSAESHRLGALFTIYHEIPLVREIFIHRKNVLPDYGFAREWWAGAAIDLAYHLPDYEDESDSTVHREIQRLMAFLDKTERSYGSADVLANIREVRKSMSNDSDLEAAVMVAWRSVYETAGQDVIDKLFSRGFAPKQEMSEEQTKLFTLLELGLPYPEELPETLYDIADEALWPALTPLDLDTSPYLSHIAEVIAFQISTDGDDSKKAVDIPAIWYPDRYLETGREAALEMRIHKNEIHEKLRRLEEQERRLTTHEVRGGKEVKVKDMLEACLQHNQAQLEKDRNVSEDSDQILSRSSSKTVTLSLELRKLVANIDKKLIALNDEKEKAHQTIKELSKLFTEQSAEVGARKLRKYCLRGVSTTKNTTYVCRRAEPDLIDMDLDKEVTSSKRDQWWRINFESSGENPVTVEKTTEDMVLQAAKTESKNITLVYASEAAMDYPWKPLPDELEAFVTRDNGLFKAEFAEDEAQMQLQSPGKRKFDERSDRGSPDSPTNRWNGSTDHENNATMMEREMGSNNSWTDTKVASQSLSGRLANDDPKESKQEILVGLDPFQMNGQSSGQEMQERPSMPMMASLPLGKTTKPMTIDSMDLDEVLEDDKLQEPSPAVKHVGFRE
ncbi:hypothetical protein BGZ60DRAFT_208922 [Tricladium varicosporioides]|nr:hypothetical protein BGZ60DRAFT_208922 [Hymenoscyphus varicosporioides]